MKSTQLKFSRPQPQEYNKYYDAYISKFEPDDFLAAFAGQTSELQSVLGNLSNEEVSCLHEPYTWTLKQLMGHLIDTFGEGWRIYAFIGRRCPRQIYRRWPWPTILKTIPAC